MARKAAVTKKVGGDKEYILPDFIHLLRRGAVDAKLVKFDHTPDNHRFELVFTLKTIYGDVDVTIAEKYNTAYGTSSVDITTPKGERILMIGAHKGIDSVQYGISKSGVYATGVIRGDAFHNNGDALDFQKIKYSIQPQLGLVTMWYYREEEPWQYQPSENR